LQAARQRARGTADARFEGAGGTMSALGNLAYRTMIGRAAHAVLVGRPRSRAHPARGRFDEADVEQLLDVVWRFERALPGPTDPRHDRRIRMTVRLAGFSLAMLDALQVRDVERGYAIELVADVAARVARWWARIGRGVLRRSPWWPERGRVPFALCPAAVETRPTGAGGFEVTDCPVATFLRAHDAADLCRAAWCDTAYAVSEQCGMTLCKAGTLAAGAPACHLWWQRT
jgi:hypothetical protein